VSDARFFCHVCDQELIDFEVIVYVDPDEYDEHREYAKLKREADKVAPPPGTLSVSDVLAAPPVARWRTAHSDCLPDDAGRRYWFDVPSIRTAARALWWTVHLLNKRGYPNTRTGVTSLIATS
jgi:hypothetical protein